MARPDGLRHQQYFNNLEVSDTARDALKGRSRKIDPAWRPNKQLGVVPDMRRHGIVHAPRGRPTASGE
jgi:hypothetical protein